MSRLERDADYYNKRIHTLKEVHSSEVERCKHLEKAVELSKDEVSEFMKRQDDNIEERRKQAEYVSRLEEGVQEQEEHVAEMKRKINQVRRELQDKDVNAQTLRQQVKRVQLRAKNAEELQRAKADSAGDLETKNRQLALLAAIRYTNQRIKQLEGEKLGAVHRDLDEQDGKTVHQRKANQLLREENDKTKQSINEEMEQQRRYIEEVAAKIETTRRDIAQLEASFEELESAPQSIALSTEVLEGVIQHLKDQIAQTERDRSAIEEEKKTLVQRIMRSTDPDAKMRECMMLLKSAVINLWKDYQTIGQVRERIIKRPDQEAVFKEAHNTIKTAIRSIIKAQKRPAGDDFQKGRKVELKWNVVEKDIEKLDTHKLRTIFRALQEMVIAWDVMPHERKAKMSTCEEVVANALLLYALARHTLTYQNKNLMEKRMQLDQSESRLTKKGAYTLPRDEEGNAVLPSPGPGARRAPPAAATPTGTRKPLRYQTPEVGHDPHNRDVSPGSFL
eukprot:TRINITY_DN13718_c0_g1_i1.p1 TRINITY_DN13718_c0_g1~~TRINITY_DN13718_c0_g1_i1.p1  ORF type:complete len:505 (+),score=258.03 TRINITY_DN13718_c0_g1_i1:153-1667(+)